MPCPFDATRHENFGHAVVEAWAHGRPVLLSDQTPWRGLAELDLGWDLPLKLALWTRAFESAMRWTEEEWVAMSKACEAKHQSLIADPMLVENNKALFIYV